MPNYTASLNQARRAKATKKKVKVRKELSPAASEISDVEFFLIGLIAAINDLCDWLGLDLLLFRLIDLVTAGILGLWCLVRLHRFPGARFGTTFLTELIPGLGDLLPTWTIFVISIYLEEKGYLSKTLAKPTKIK